MLSCSATNHLEMLAESRMTVYFAFTLPGSGQRFHCLVWSFSHGIFPRATFSASKQTYNPAKTNKGDKRYGSESLNHPTLEVTVYQGGFSCRTEKSQDAVHFQGQLSCSAFHGSWYLSIKQESHKEFLSSSI